MTFLGPALLISVLLLLSGVFSGSETGVYSISRMRLDAEASEGRRAARLVRRLLKSDTGFLITLLIGNNLMLELLTHTFENEILSGRVPPGAREIAVTLLLTPIVFLFGELLPKDFFRRRPHRLLLLVSPFLALARILALPLALPLQFLTFVLERAFGLRPREMPRALRRESMLELLQEGTRTGALAPRAIELARNVLVLSETPVSKVMVPWSRVRTLDLGASDDDVRAQLEASEFTRVPAIDRAPAASGFESDPVAARAEMDGARTEASAAQEGQVRRVVGYVHQLDVLGVEGEVRSSLREIPRIDPETPVDRALARLRMSGQRLALVGPWEEPVGLVTLMDLVAAISAGSRDRTGDAR